MNRLNQERAKFVDLFDLAPVGYFILDYLGNVEEANQNGVDLLDISKEKILHRRFQSFIAPQCWEDFYLFLHRMQYNEGKQSVELKLGQSAERWVYTRMEGIVISSILVTDSKYYITVIDITDSRNAQQTLKDAKERLEMTLKASSTGTWTVGCTEETVFLDPHSLKILGISDSMFDGTVKGLVALVYPEDRQLVCRYLLSANSGSKEIDLEFRVKTAGNDIKYIAAKGQEIKTPEISSYFTGILMDITARKKMEQEAEMLKNGQQKLILSATLTAQEKERNNISRALHDSICQLLYGIGLNLDNIQRNHHLQDEFRNVRQLLDQAINETRQISYDLTPSVLRDFGFAAGVKEMAQRTSTSDFMIYTRIDQKADVLNPDVQLYVFRMIQELINNCIKHAHASFAEIEVNIKAQQVLVKVSDNGSGLTTDMEGAMQKGSGLSGIKNRVYLLNGQLKFNNSKKGFTVTIVFNYLPQSSA